MGNTVRREPVNFDIPASPNYKFLNITNFRGLDVSSNPFELATNTASDCLNVYVDETNTLTTRPRLCKKEFKNANGDFIVPLGGTCVGVYNLHNGYLLHHIIDDTPVMRLFVDGVLKEPVSGDIPTTHCTHFENGEDIYLLTGEDYLVIKDNVINKVVGYVPNKSIVTLDGKEIDDAPLNILSDEYTTSYAWDGRSEPFINLTDSDVENGKYTKRHLETLYNKTIICVYEDGSVLHTPFDQSEIYYTETTQDLYEHSTTRLSVSPWVGYNIIAGSGSKAFWCADSVSGKFVRYDLTNSDEITSNFSTLSWTSFYEFTLIAVSDDNNRVVIRFAETANDYDSGTYKFIVLSFDGNNITQNTLTGLPAQLTSFPLPKINITRVSGQYYYISTYDDKIYVTTDSNLNFEVFDTTESITDINSVVIGMTDETGILYYGSDNKLFYYTNLDNTTKTEIDVKTTSFKWNETEKYAYGINDITKTGYLSDRTYELVIYPNFPKTQESYVLSTVSSGFVDSFGYGVFALKKYLIDVPITGLTDTAGKILAYDNDGIIKKHHRLSKTSSLMTDISEKRNILLKAKLNARFDNNHWLAKDNKYFRTANNDPTYFPITEYSELGDNNESITGFNIANDTTLLVYKTDRLYLIQPYTSSLDTREYAITESKNTVGNTAVGAPIVTTLTEIPLQINYDGIYGLSQLQNVSAVERIADLMSEPINDRWLNEDDVVIKKAKTLNRLYWTYIILPYESVTKIYLLDNRTNSWYYWELPIELLEAFAKDNRAEFVDTDGNIYYLTTTDIKNAGFDTQLVTEYYDDGKKLINWFWQSQILPMGTMNYAKRLVNTTFILTDTDTQDGYGLKYNFKVFRKLASSTPEKEINDELNLVRSTTKKTNISKFGFIQLKISNITEESQGTEAEKAYRNNKLRLVGLGLKYVLLEGLIR